MVTTTPTIDRAAQTANVGVDAGPTNNDQFEPKIVALDDGRFVVFWTDNSDAAPGQADGTDILAQIFDAFGNAVGNVARVNNGWFNHDEGGLDGAYSVAALPGGKFVVAYEDTDVNGVSIRSTVGTVLSDNTMSFVDHSILGDPGAEFLSTPAVTGFSDGSYMVVYSNSTSGTSTSAYGKVVDSGGTVGSEFAVLTGSDDVGNTRNGVATLTNGNVVTVHAHRVSPDGDRGLFMRILSPTGSNVLPATEVAGTSGDTETDTQPVVAALTGGGYVIAWTNADSNDHDILFQMYDSSGAEVGSTRAVNGAASTDNYNEPTIIGLADGGFFVAYDDDGVGIDAIRGQRFDASGNEVGSSVTFAATTAIESAPTLSLTGDGRILVAWLSNVADNNDIKMAIYDPRDTVINGDNSDNVILARLDENTLINGLDGADQIFGRFGADTLNGGAGDDSLVGNDGRDLLDGGADNDTLYGNGGDDTMFGGDGDDTLSGEQGRDLMYGNDGADTLHGFGSHDSLYGGAGNDDLRGGHGKDLLGGSAGNDVLRGFDGDDRLFGGGNNDTLIGNEGNDSLIGGGGTDRLKGDDGDDTLYGSYGDDTVTGGTGDDVFQFRKTHDADVITDFTAGAGTDDKIQLLAFGAAFDTFGEVIAAASQVGSDTVIDFGGGDTLTLLNVTIGSLHSSDFIF